MAAPDELTSTARSDAVLTAEVDRLEQLILASPPSDPTDARNAVTSFKKLRRFEHVDRLARAYEKQGLRDDQVRIAGAQALIELGKLGEAIKSLRALEQELGANEERRDTRSEVYGLLGRCYKQLYVLGQPTTDEPRTYDLERALSYYRRGYALRTETDSWHGVNIVALLCHQQRVFDPAAALPEEARALGVEMRARLSSSDPWSAAIAAELGVAFGERKVMLDELAAFLGSDRVAAFHVGSAIRQMIELWGMNDQAEPGATVLPMMAAALLDKGGRLELEARPAQLGRFQKLFDETNYQPASWVKRALERGRSVARLGKSAFVGQATGVVVLGESVSPAHAGKLLLLTNAHAVSPDPFVRLGHNAIAPEETVACFAFLEGEPEFRVEKCLYTSPPGGLDTTVLLLPDAARAQLGGFAPPFGTDPKASHLINIIGFPLGGPLSFSIRNNQVTELQGPYLRYRAPTNAGSSGSPVFNENWEMVALHHRALDAANEGVLLSSILDELRR